MVYGVPWLRRTSRPRWCGSAGCRGGSATVGQVSRSVAGACPLDCPDTCAWHIEVDASGRAVSLRGDREHPFTRGALCGKVNRYLDALYAPDRLLHPLRRVGAKGAGQFERISWEEAVELAARGIQRAIDEDGPESVLPYYYAGTMGQVQGWTLGPRLFAALGASKLGTTICSAASTAALTAIHGAKVGLDPEDIAHARLVLIWGGNLLYSNVHQWRFILTAREAGGTSSPSTRCARQPPITLTSTSSCALERTGRWPWG